MWEFDNTYRATSLDAFDCNGEICRKHKNAPAFNAFNAPAKVVGKENTALKQHKIHASCFPDDLE
jgi:hypothetical protein